MMKKIYTLFVNWGYCILLAAFFVMVILGLYFQESLPEYIFACLGVISFALSLVFMGCNIHYAWVSRKKGKRNIDEKEDQNE